MNKSIVIITLNLFCVSFILLIVAACNRSTDKKAERKTLVVSTMRVESQQIVRSETYIGKTQECISLSLGFPFGGKVTSVHTHKGKYIHKGDILVKIDDTQQQNALKSAEATLNQAKDAYQRLHKVYEQGALAEVKWVEIQTNLNKAEAAYNMACKQLKECTLYAPQDGITEECDLHAGQQLLPSQTAVRLINTEGIEVIFSVPETEINGISIGDEVSIRIPALEDLQLTGKITEKNMTANRITHSYTVTTIINNKDGRLLPGMFCKVNIPKQDKKGFIIPADCIQTMTEAESVWIVKNGYAHRQIVKASVFANGGVLVESGIEQGDTIITKGWQKVWEGVEIAEQE